LVIFCSAFLELLSPAALPEPWPLLLALLTPWKEFSAS
jgi:hypothetical protein